MKKLMELINIEAKLFVRDFFGFFFTFVFPAFMLLLYGSIYGNEPTPYFNGLGTMDVSVPAYSAMIIGVTGLMVFPLTLSGYKESKIYKRFDVTPAGKGLVITAQMIVNTVMTLAGFALLFLLGKTVYHIRTEGSLPAILFTLLLSMAAIFSMGFFFTAISPNVKINSLLCYVSYFVMIFLSGATMPRELFPEAVKQISVLLPLTHAVNVLQGAFRGAPFHEYQSSAGLLAALFLFCTGTGAVLYQKKSWI